MRLVRTRLLEGGAPRAPHPTPRLTLIEFTDVGHTYRSLLGRRVRAVDGFTLRIEAGEVLGLAGPNGAGKSTLISLLLGYLAPSDGALRIDGLPPRAYVERHGIGYLSELINLPPRWTLEQTLVRMALLAGVPAGEMDGRVERAIERLGIGEHRGKRVKQLSKGNLQRLGLAQALLHEERVLVLDEPTHGLDPVWTQRFRDIVVELRRPERVVFIASHNLDELQRLADRVVIIDHGRVQRVVNMRLAASEIVAAPYRLSLVANDAMVREVFPDAECIAPFEWEVPARDLASLNQGVAEVIARGGVLRAMGPAHSVLEQQFREAVGGDR
ncbi:MAG TPA: ABC transporter ATP-binding protein [Gemmatimonadaceae bacterium]|nr:ABC transporter ATP-binding protein [Gemmatimonadaceae bacterium]